MNEHEETGHVDAEPTQELMDKRDKALEEHRQRVSTEASDADKVDYLTENARIPVQDEDAAADATRGLDSQPTLFNDDPVVVPERPEHSQYETEVVNTTSHDADFDAEERKEDDNA